MSRRSRQIRASHAGLLCDGSAPAGAAASTKLDAIVVPAARRASELQPVIRLAADLRVPLVILCSREALLDKVVERVKSTFHAQALVIQVPEDYRPPCPTPKTSDRKFQEASAGRSSDLSAKRNLGLLYGRLRGWNKILFVDDDIRGLRRVDVDRLTGYLDRHPVASMASREFPDNSVVCHARGLVAPQDVFVSGAVLGVDLQRPELSFFADIYNEDWFFFARYAARRAIPKIGEVRQLQYEPFADPQRAAREEFGDLLAEGLYAAFESQPGMPFEEQLRLAMEPTYWDRFKGIRLETIEDTLAAIRNAKASIDDKEFPRIVRSLETARTWAHRISSSLCVEFIKSWQEDEELWQKMLSNLPSRQRKEDALSRLQLTNWVSCGYGLPTESQADLATAGAVC
ncbi:hypothetical protein [Kribbella sp.]|uniref:hypothetical protein n=1 Tax=Kribbella sp. TaxID=1871183 RepID=UPI002D401BF6|nr:hypothetical protein [Kribbella sp.]HZX05916.1 hypothetical protein [Kribbella sp.]